MGLVSQPALERIDGPKPAIPARMSWSAISSTKASGSWTARPAAAIVRQFRARFAEATGAILATLEDRSDR